MKKKLNIKAILIPVIAVVLVAAVVISVVLLSVSKPVAAFNAVRKTVFESETLTATFYTYGEEVNKIDAQFGDGIDDSSIILEQNKAESYAIVNGEIRLGGRSIGKVDDIVDRMNQMGQANYGIETSNLDLIEILDTIINGKIDEEAFAEFYDNEVIPTFKKSIKQSYDASVEIPTYEQTMDMIERFLKKYLTEDAVSFEKAESEEKGTTYDYTIRVDELAECLGEFAKEDKEAREYLEIFLEESDSSYESVDDMVDDVVDEYRDVDEKIRGEVTVRSGRITRVMFERYETEFEIRIDSAE